MVCKISLVKCGGDSLDVASTNVVVLLEYMGFFLIYSEVFVLINDFSFCSLI